MHCFRVPIKLYFIKGTEVSQKWGIRKKSGYWFGECAGHPGLKPLFSCTQILKISKDF